MMFFLKKIKTKNGIASLPVIILLGGIVMEIGIAGAVLLFYLNNSLYGTKLANEALSVAQSGVNDAIFQVILDKSTSGDIPAFAVGNGTAEVSIAQSCGVSDCVVTITSTGTVLTREHTIVAELNVNSDTGLVSITSILENQ